ncbi:type IV pilus assembly protein PilC [Terrimicrobium sacchariphilum]|uniref:Type IV pilus assembly protein PilC n=1 Tax=Terrimicrobium sacchariphilum TaxID=690879 RepID=A0A146G999_TERSA|nr:type II secretion system F family protein [Terrimicrobium sacchariphilum]GAT33417.1 type IV pilus assembly protein PilC [Terrimicrobium sacchariphilum]
MLKKVVLTNINTARSFPVIVDTDDDQKAILGAGKAPNETAVVTDIVGVDEAVHRGTTKAPGKEEMVTLFGGLARCLERNISTVKSLELISGRLSTPRYRGAVADIAQKVLEGEKLSDCFGMHPDLFTEDIVALIRAGEESGQVHEVFRQVARSNDKTQRVLKKLRAGLVYPAIVLVLAIAVVIVMSFTLVPAISKLYGAMHVTLPVATRMMMAFSQTLIKQPYFVLIPIIGLGALFKYWPKIYRIPRVQLTLTRVPTVGNIIRKSAAMVSFRCLSMLLHANVRISTALEISARSANHVEFEQFFLRVRDHIIEGMSLPEGFLMESHLLGPDGRMIAGVVQMAGETGGVNELLDEIAADYEEELDIIAGQLDKIMEPFMIVFLAVVVGFLIYAIYGPIFNLSQVLLPKKPGAPVPTAEVSR